MTTSKNIFFQNPFIVFCEFIYSIGSKSVGSLEGWLNILNKRDSIKTRFPKAIKSNDLRLKDIKSKLAELRAFIDKMKQS